MSDVINHQLGKGSENNHVEIVSIVKNRVIGKKIVTNFNGDLERTRVTPGSRKLMGVNNKTIFLINQNKITCELDTVKATKTCRILGNLIHNGETYPESKILCDSGASFSVISKQYLDSIGLQPEMQEPMRKNAHGASGASLNIVGDCFLDVSFKSLKGTLELRKVRFAILDKISVSIIIGCEILTYLNFEMNSDSVVLNKEEIPRIMSVSEGSGPLKIHFPVKTGIDINYDGHHRTVLKVDVDNNIRLRPNSVYHVSFYDSFTDNRVISPDNSGRYTLSRVVPTGDEGELQAFSDLLAFDGQCTKIPSSVDSLFIGILDTSASEYTGINSLGDSKKSLTQETFDGMVTN